MVRIINYKKVNKDGKEFFILEVTGGIEMVLSKSTGMYYATMRRATVSSTFTEEVCKSLVGTQMPGKVVKQQCDPYEYTVKETGEVVTLKHRYVYEQDPQEVLSALPQEKHVH